MLKNFVIVKHLADSGKFLFYVPKSITLSAGEQVVCDTRYGSNQLGVCCCDSFMAEPSVVCPLFGTEQRVMKYVTGKVEYQKFEEAYNEDAYAEKFAEE